MNSLFQPALASKLLGTQKVYYREGTSDEAVLSEVLNERVYRRASIDFDVEQGERWLDLGANIGAFALYCKQRGATAVCYEPDPESFEVLCKNVPDFHCYNTAVTNLYAPTIPFYRTTHANPAGIPGEQNYARLSACPTVGMKLCGTYANKHAGFLRKQEFDGVKMDIEGSEAGLLDEMLLPQCRKLVLEYHLLRDSSVANLERRIKNLQKRFQFVKYPPEYDRMMRKGGEARSYYDRLIFGWNA